MFQVNIVLPSGRCESLSLPRSSKVGDLKILPRPILDKAASSLSRQKDMSCSILWNLFTMPGLKMETTSLRSHVKAKLRQLQKLLLCGAMEVTGSSPGEIKSSKVSSLLSGISLVCRWFKAHTATRSYLMESKARHLPPFWQMDR